MSWFDQRQCDERRRRAFAMAGGLAEPRSMTLKTGRLRPLPATRGCPGTPTNRKSLLACIQDPSTPCCRLWLSMLPFPSETPCVSGIECYDDSAAVLLSFQALLQRRGHDEDHQGTLPQVSQELIGTPGSGQAASKVQVLHTRRQQVVCRDGTCSLAGFEWRAIG